MSEPIKIHGKFLTAEETAAVLGVSKRRTKQLVSMLRDLETGEIGRAAEKRGRVEMTKTGKRAATKSASPRRSNGSKPMIGNATTKTNAKKRPAAKSAGR